MDVFFYMKYKFVSGECTPTTTQVMTEKSMTRTASLSSYTDMGKNEI